MTESTKAVFLSYASEDGGAAARLCASLRAAGIEVWFDQSELRGGAVWDRQIRKEIHDCALFMPIISASTQARPEGYFRLEWKLGVERTHLMSDRVAFLVPVVVDGTSNADADVPDAFRAVQWTRIPGGETPLTFCQRVAALIAGTEKPGPTPLSSRLVPPAASTRTLHRRIAIVIAVVIVVAAVALKPWQLVTPKPAAVPVAAPVVESTTTATPEKSVAVLPFVDMSEKKNQEYFSDGLTEELIDHLARTADLKVIARTSSFQFKGKNEDMRTIGQRLGVANLLEGSVRKSGKTVRVTAQLIKVSDGSHLWSQSFDRDIHDIFKVQDSIAVAVVTALRTTLAAHITSSQEIPKNIEAYNALLRARYFYGKQTKQDMERGIAVSKEAIKIDPGYARAWVTLADGYNFLGVRGWMRPKEAYAAARAAVNRALSIDPELAAAHETLSDLEWNYNRDFAAYVTEVQRGSELRPDPTGDLWNAGFLALAAGHFDEAIRAFQKVAERDPLDVWVLNLLYLPLFAAGKLPEAERVTRRWLDLEPNSTGAHCALGQVLLAENKPAAAFGVMSAEPDEAARLLCLPDALWVLGRRAEADAMLAEAVNKYAGLEATLLAGNYAIRNDKEEAFKWLARAYDNREPFITLIKANGLLNNLHDDPRFIALVRKMKLPE